MNRPTIAVDIDDVLVDRVKAIQTYLNDYFDSDLDISLMRAGDSFFEFVIYHFRGRSNRLQLSRIIEDYVSSPAYMSIQPSKDAVRVIRNLAKTYDLAIVSQRPKAQHAATKHWLTKHFDESFEEILIINSGHFGRDVLPGNFSSKADFCREQGHSYIIDDRLKTCIDSAKYGLNAVLFGDYPWNSPAELPKGVTRAKNWLEVKEFFDGRGGA